MSVRHTSFPHFSRVCFNRSPLNLKASFYTKSYRSSSIPVMIDLLFHELLPFVQNSLCRTSYPHFCIVPSDSANSFVCLFIRLLKQNTQFRAVLIAFMCCHFDKFDLFVQYNHTIIHIRSSSHFKNADIFNIFSRC